MTDNRASPHADASGPTEDAESALADAVDRPGEPDMAPTVDAFDAPAPFDTPVVGEVDRDDRMLRAAAGGWLARLPGERRYWIMGSVLTGGVLLGGLLSGGIAWKMIGSRDAEVLARAARIDAQSSQLAQQADLIKVLTRAIDERPLPDHLATDPALAPVAGSAMPTAAPAPAIPAAPPAAAAADSAPGSFRERPAAEVAPARTFPTAGVSPGYAGSGICDIPGGSEGPARMRKCIEWFAGRDTGASRAAP
jgi:hypothetical protein